MLYCEYSISNWTNDIRYLKGRSNLVADLLSRPNDHTIGKVYQMPEQIATTTVQHELFGRKKEQKNVRMVIFRTE